MLKKRPITYFKTKKLFYNRFPYRIVVNNCESYLIRFKIPKDQEEYLVCTSYSMWSGAKSNPTDIVDLKRFLKSLNKLKLNKVKLRDEGHLISIFLEDESDFRRAFVALKKWVSSVSEPENNNDLALLKEKTETILCTKYPHTKYRYRIYLNEKMTELNRTNFFNWVNGYGESIKIPPTTERWLSQPRAYASKPYFYIEKTELLAMIGMFLGNDIYKKQEFVLRSTAINSVSEDENAITEQNI